VTQPASARVRAVADAYLRAWSRQHLALAVYLGAPLERHDALPDNSLAGIRAWQAREDAWLAELVLLDASALTGEDRVAYGLLREELEASVGVRIARPELCTVDQVGGWHLFHPPVAEAQPVGTDDLAEARRRLRTAPEYRFATADEVMAAVRETVERAWERLPAWFGAVPRARVVVEAMPASSESAPSAIYVPSADGRPGTYQVNTHPAAALSRFRADSIALHETVPGHHLQLGLARERADAHPLTRVLGNSGFVEGWATYAEALADEMGLYTTDLARLGWLAGRAFSAAWAVVDTGIHALGWTRERARDLLVARTTTPPERVDAMIDLAAVWPGQPASYLLGGAEMQRLRADAAAALGAAFDLRRFHAAVLEDGSVTLPMLRARIARWIAAERRCG
jgi:uncharacterized protein (DUF885 family)